eukprot:1726568-Alexandrium_andersonii.AAC.1
MPGGCTGKRPFRCLVQPTIRKALSRQKHNELWSRRVGLRRRPVGWILSLIHISEPTRLALI